MKKYKVSTDRVLITLLSVFVMIIFSGCGVHMTGSQIVNLNEAVASSQEAAQEARWTLLEEDLAGVTEKMCEDGEVSYIITDLTTQKSIAYNPDAVMFAASTYKLPLAMIYYDDAILEEAGLLSRMRLSQTHMESLLEKSIVDSDNDSAQVLYESLGGWQSYRNLAETFTTHESPECFFTSLENLTTATYMNDVLIYLYAHAADYETLLADLQKAEPSAYLNSVMELNTCQKYGWYGSAFNSVGLVLEDCAPYAISVFTDNVEAAEIYMGEMNSLCFRYFNSVS